MRATVHLLSLHLFGSSLPLGEFPHCPDRRGAGLSDWDGYANLLRTRLDYVNTYYHQEPFLDITRPDPASWKSLDFLISNDVFEHVLPPVSAAFLGARRLLKPGGALILNVPYGLFGRCAQEHYPDATGFEVMKLDGRWSVRWRDLQGRVRESADPVFHGGPGETLELRMFSLHALRQELAAAGFRTVRSFEHDVDQWGIVWQFPWSQPILAV